MNNKVKTFLFVAALTACCLIVFAVAQIKQDQAKNDGNSASISQAEALSEAEEAFNTFCVLY